MGISFKTLLLYCLIIFISVFLAYYKLGENDLDGNEQVYIAASIGYFRNDPYIVPRHHLKRIVFPCSPFPFLIPLMHSLVFNFWEPDLVSTRLIYAGSIVLSTVLVMILTHSLFKSHKISLFSGLIFTTSPLVIHYSRLSILDPLMGSLAGFMFIYLWYTVSKKRYQLIWAGLAGIFAAFTASAKLTGIFYVFFGALFLLGSGVLKKKLLLNNLISYAITFGSTFYLLNDPQAYIYGWTHFSDPRIKQLSILVALKGWFDFKYWFKFAQIFLGPIFVLLLLYSIYILIKQRNRFNNKTLLLLAFVLSPTSYLLINPPHATGVSSEWAYVPLIMALSPVLAYSAAKLTRKYYHLLMVTYALSVSLNLILFGLSTQRLPLYRGGPNIIMGENSQYKTIQLLNKQSRGGTVLHYTEHLTLPIWLIHNKFPTNPFYQTLETYTYVLTDNEELVDRALKNNFAVLSKTKDPGMNVFLYLLENARNR